MQQLDNDEICAKERSVNRRDFLRNGSFVVAGAMLGTTGVLSACSDSPSSKDTTQSEAAASPTQTSDYMFDEPEMKTLAKRFFDLAESDEKDEFLACFAPDAMIWINTGEMELTSDEIAEVLMVKLSGVVTDKKYEQRRVNAFPGGFVERHLLCGTRKSDGYRVEMPACLVIEVNDEGEITRLDNYEDSAKAAEFYV